MGESKVDTEINLEPSKSPRNSPYRLSVSKPGEKITYTWRNISVTTGDDKQSKGFLCCKKDRVGSSKQILHNVSGTIRPGELVALFGASGAGKSTLLNVLTFRNTSSLKITGDRMINGVPIGPEAITALSAYVQQDDLFIGTLTVREHLVFQALVRMHPHIPYQQRMDRVEEVIGELGLSKCADAKIGIPGRVKGISGGEMKRLAFASEVLTDPPIMFCDEPTSGLDSFMAENVVSVLKNLASKGKTIFCTIHQPASQVFEMFDKILLMAEGRVAFSGSIPNALQFFDKIGHACPTNYNPSDHFIQVLAIQPGSETVQSLFRSLTICEKFQESHEGKELMETVNATELDKNSSVYELSKAAHNGSPYKATWFQQFRAVLWRSNISNLKDPMFLRVKIFQSTLLALIIGFVFFGQEYNQDGVQNINGAIFLLVTNLTFTNAFGVIDVFCLELPIFLREHFNGMYRTDVYFLSKMLAELPFYIIFPFIFIGICYFMIGLTAEVTIFLTTAGIYLLVANCAVSFGYLVSCIASNVTLALALGPALIIPLMLFGGFFLNSGSIPVYLVWIKYISWFHYGNEAAAIVQWKDVYSIECNRENSTCPANGQVVLKTLDFEEDNLIIDIIALGALVIALRILAYLALLSKTFGRK